MRKFLSLIISLIIAFMSVADGVVAFANASKDNGLNSFAQNLIEMVREHDINLDDSASENMSVQQFYSAGPNSTEDKYSHLPAGAFASKRLVVQSEKKIDLQGAVDCVSGYRNLYILQYESIKATQQAYDYYLALDYIDYVEPDYIMKMQIEDAVDDVKDSIDGVIDDVKDYIDTDTNDKVYEITDKVTSWASDKIGFDAIKDDLAKQIKDDYIQVAVLDSGVETNHEIFEDRLIESTVNLSSSGDENSVEDDYGHGTHVAGIIVDNTLSNVKIKPYKVLNNKGKGSESLIAIAIDLAVAEGADIINMSLASNGEFQMMKDSVDNAVANDVNVVVAAGNDKKNLSQEYVSPACIESAFTVSATTQKNELASFSNYNGPVDIAAPGVDINSSYPKNKYIKLSGTSMAAPQVAAGLAIVYSAFPEKSAKEAEEMLQEYAIKIDEIEGQNYFGAGILYLRYILEEIPRTAEPIFSIDSCTFNNSFTLTITCPEKGAKIYYLISDEKNVVVNFITGELYTKSLTISLDTTIYAVAISDGKLFSNIVKKEYKRANNTEADAYDINNVGLIQGYFGKETDLVIPRTIRGITVRGIYNGAFKDNTQVHSVSLPETAAKIYDEAFMNSSVEKVSGKGLLYVEKNAFTNSSIEDFPFEQIVSVGSGAFQNCKNLKDVNLQNVATIQSNAFTSASGITKVINENLTTLGSEAFSFTDIEEVSIPNITSLSSGVFRGCEKLVTASVPYAKNIASNAFLDCVSLKKVDISDAETLGASCFSNTGLEYASFKNVKSVSSSTFANNTELSLVSLVNVSSIGTYAFRNCPELQIVYLPALKTLTNNSFSECPKLLSLWLPSVESINRATLDDSSIEYLQLDNVKIIRSLPQTLKGVLVPSSLTSISATIPATDFIVYGYTGTYAEDFARNNNKQFSTVPAIVYDLEEKVNTEDRFILVYALGFNCKYQWYKNDALSNEGGILIEGATNYYYEPSRNDNATSYYCVITSSDGINTNIVTTNYIENAYEYREADYTEYNEIIEFYNSIDKSLYKDGTFDEVDQLLSINISNLSLAQQDLLDSHVEKIKKAIDSAELKFVLCDINSDGKISIIDARLALKAVVGSYALNETQTLAADVNGDGKVSIADSRAILKSVVNK